LLRRADHIGSFSLADRFGAACFFTGMVRGHRDVPRIEGGFEVVGRHARGRMSTANKPTMKKR
jgi:hypothetical protein